MCAGVAENSNPEGRMTEGDSREEVERRGPLDAGTPVEENGVFSLSGSEGQPWKLDYSRFEAARKEADNAPEPPPWFRLGNLSDFVASKLGSPRDEQQQGVAMRQWQGQEGGNASETDQLVPAVGPKLSGFYQKQNETIDAFSEMENIKEHLLPTDEEEEAKEQLERHEQLAIQISNVANIFLLGAKIWASVESLSLSVITSTLDSLLDCLSGFILWFTARSIRTASRYKYPIGSKRMQPLGIIVFASVMATLGFQVLLEAGRQLAAGTGSSQSDNDWPWLVGIMGGATIVKLGLFLYCNSFDNEIVRAYALDHFFDVMTNSVGLAAALLGEWLAGWIDPAGAIVLALYTMRLWSVTVWENVNSLTGESASPLFLQKLTYLCWNHHPKIRCIDTVRAYTFGTHYFAEVDIVLPADMALQEAHDIGESLQNKLELVPEVERAFVHLDYEYSHQPEHSGSFKMKAPAGTKMAEPSAQGTDPAAV